MVYTFDYSTLDAYFSKTENDRNKWISDSESRNLEGITFSKGGIIFVQLTYMCTERCAEAVLFTHVLP